MKWKRFVCAVSIISMLFSATQVAYASYSYISKDTTNVVTISNIGITLEYSEETADRLSFSMVRHKKVAVKNTGKKPVYVRLRFDKYWSEIDTSAGEGERIDSAICNPDYISFETEENEDWTYNESDGYFYYKTLLKVKETTSAIAYSYQITDDIVEQVRDKDDCVVETRYKKKYQDRQGNVSAYAEAVQDISEQFLHDYVIFDSGEAGKVAGWNNDRIKFNSTAIPETSKTPNVVSSSQPNVEFADDASQFITLHGENLFLNMSDILPGDTKIQDITIANRSEEQVAIYLYAKPAENDYSNKEAMEAMELLLQNIELKVNKVLGDGTLEEIYKGTLGEMSNEKGEENKILLGVFKKGDMVDLRASITLNPDWNIGNAETKIKWVFFCMKELTDTPEPTVPMIVKPVAKPTPATPIPVITEPPTAVPTQAPIVIEKTKEPELKPTEIVQTTAPTPTPVITEMPKVTITPAVPTPTKGVIGDLELDGTTPEPIEEVPTIIPMEEQDEPMDPNAGVKGTIPSPKPTEKPYTNPKTGDANSIVLWSAVFILSFIVFIVTVKSSKKSKTAK